MYSRQKTLLSGRGLRLCFLTLFISGCANLSQPLGPVETKVQQVPKALLTRCPVPSIQGNSNESLYLLAEDRKLALQECNKRLGDIEQWSNDDAAKPAVKEK